MISMKPSLKRLSDNEFELNLYVELEKVDIVDDLQLTLHVIWPKEQGSLGAAIIDSSMESSQRIAGQGVGTALQVGSPVISFQLSSSSEHGIAESAVIKFGSNSERVVIISKFHKNIAFPKYAFSIACPVKEVCGIGRGAKIKWKVDAGQAWNEIGVPVKNIYQDTIYHLLPSPYDNYHGQKRLREDVYSQLVSQNGPQCILLHGMGGIGKTSFARSILESIEPPLWTCVIGFTAKSNFYDPKEGTSIKLSTGIQGKREMYHKLSNDLCLSWDGREVEFAQKLVKQKLGAQKRTLFILDNLETVNDFGNLVPEIMGFMPEPPQGVVIVTTREIPDSGAITLLSKRKTGIAKKRIPPLGQEEIKLICKDIVNNQYPYDIGYSLDDSALQLIAKKSEGHPLSAKLFTHAVMLSQDKNILNSADNWEGLMNYCLNAQWERLKHPQRVLLGRLSRLPHGLIPLQNLKNRIVPSLGEDAVQKAIESLYNLSFIVIGPQRTDRKDYITIHSLIREWVSKNG